MPSNNSKYTEEMRERMVRHILSSGKSATSVGEERGIDANTVCRWVRDHRRKNNLQTYQEEKGITKRTEPKGSTDEKRKIHELSQILLL